MDSPLASQPSLGGGRGLASILPGPGTVCLVLGVGLPCLRLWAWGRCMGWRAPGSGAGGRGPGPLHLEEARLSTWLGRETWERLAPRPHMEGQPHLPPSGAL